ncbi:TetR/AcrR family transcriptional regulator [Nocardia beijingensis]
MPKLVDHEERRHTITAAVWRLIARRGLDAVNMRDIANEAGYANGSLSHYFKGKDDILRFAYEHVYDATERRIAAALGEATGLDALRVFCHEVMPTTQETLLEARIAISLWQRAIYDEHLGSVNERALADWRDRVVGFLDQALEAGDIAPVDTQVVADQILTILAGTQIVGVLLPGLATGDRQVEMLEALLDRIRS